MSSNKTYTLSQWEKIKHNFEVMFSHLGKTTIDDNMISFESVPPSVSTGVSASKSGHLLANMPLHNIDAKFCEVYFDPQLHSIRFIGEHLDYTYIIPAEIQKLNDE